MKNILIPTDFSSFAKNAWDVALKLAKINSVDLHLIHCPDIPLGWEGWPVREQDKEPDIQEQVDQLQDRLKTEHPIPQEMQPKVHLQIVGGKIYEAIKTYVNRNGIDLIVMGSHGASGKQEYFVGSNTQKVVRSVNTNILVIKNKMNELEFSNVLFASGLSVDDLESFRRFLRFINPFQPKVIHLLAVNIPGFFTQPSILMHEGLNELKSIAKGYNCQKHFLSDLTVESGIRHFSQENNIDLIAISNHEKHPWKRVFRGSNVEFIVNHAEVPVLSLDHLDAEAK